MTKAAATAAAEMNEPTTTTTKKIELNPPPHLVHTLNNGFTQTNKGIVCRKEEKEANYTGRAYHCR